MNDYQKLIFAELIRTDNCSVEELSSLLGISNSTIRRQLTDMEQNGILIRMHGGAKLAIPIIYKLPYENRAAHANDAKRQIAAAAFSLISPNQVIGLSGGTTCTALARLFHIADDITVVTNAINIALEIQPQANRRIKVTGGLLNQNYELVGQQVSQSLQNVHLDIAFLGVSRINSEFGFLMSNEEEAVIGQSFMACADRTVILADHSKIGGSSFARLCSIKDVSLLITDNQVSAQDLNSLQKAGLKVLVASPDGEVSTQ
jgi:DeoR family transcriptional regulator, aga operon transcriptional repressor